MPIKVTRAAKPARGLRGDDPESGGSENVPLVKEVPIRHRHCRHGRIREVRSVEEDEAVTLLVKKDHGGSATAVPEGRGLRSVMISRPPNSGCAAFERLPHRTILKTARTATSAAQQDSRPPTWPAIG
jgi:hypothetical protein